MNGTQIAFRSEAICFSLVHIVKSNGVYNLPDNTLIFGGLNTDKGNEWLSAEIIDLTADIGTLCIKHSIRHLALSFYKEVQDSPHVVKDATISCFRLYEP